MKKDPKHPRPRKEYYEPKFDEKGTRIFKSPTCFGAPNGNPKGSNVVAGQMRAFYKWVDNATLEELQEYVKDKNNPAMRVQYIKDLNILQPRDRVYFTHARTHEHEGMPKQAIEMENNEPIEVIFEE